MKRISKKDLFIKLASPDNQGFSRKVYVTEFVGEYEGLKMGNGGSWCRSDGSLAKLYNIKRHIHKGAIQYVQLHGFNKFSYDRPIPKRIRDELNDKRCVILDIGKIEIDHRDGRRDDPRLFDSNLVTVNDFQPLSKAANNAKRQHCKTCRETNIRYDAKKLGYVVSQIKGDEVYRGTCVGCYWYDPKGFNTFFK